MNRRGFLGRAGGIAGIKTPLDYARKVADTLRDSPYLIELSSEAVALIGQAIEDAIDSERQSRDARTGTVKRVLTPEDIIARSIPEPNTGCYLWEGAVTKSNYPSCWSGGKAVAAHRIACNCPEDLVARHTCDNPICVNPDHLIPGTHKDNADDRGRRGRYRNWQSGKTHCKRGHALTEENTFYSSGGRQCKQCKAEALRRWRASSRCSSDKGAQR